jgi:hypothetical protein
LAKNLMFSLIVSHALLTSPLSSESESPDSYRWLMHLKCLHLLRKRSLALSLICRALLTHTCISASK